MLSETKGGLSIFQGLFLLAAFWMIDAHPESRFSVFNIPYILTQHYSKQVQSEKGSGREDKKKKGLSCLLALICGFAALAFNFTHTNLVRNLL